VDFNAVGHVTEVGDNADLDSVGADGEADRICRVMRNREGIDFQVANGEPRACLEVLDGGREFAPVDGGGGEPREVQRKRASQPGEILRDGDEARDVVRMFVGDDDAGQLFGIFADARQTLERLLSAEPGVDEDSGPLRPDERAVAGTRTG
jgi:hypothetical protein